MKKSVSIVMCTYNGERFLSDQIESLLLQTRPAKEIIIVDDFSTDSTYEILCDYQKRFPNLIYIERNNRNIGINANFFYAMHLAKGDYIAISDQDDIWEPNKLEIQMELIKNNLMCAGFYKPFTTTETFFRVDKRIPNYSLLRQVFVGCLAGHTMLISKELLNLIPNSENVPRFYDVILSMVAEAYDSIVYVDKILVNHRIHTSSASYISQKENILNIQSIFKNVLQTWKYNKVLKSEIRKRLIHTLIFLEQIDSNHRNLKEAIKMLQLYISKSPIDFLKLQWFCVSHYEKLFYSSVKFNFITILRALYYPISCSEYFRYLLKEKESRYIL